MCRKLAKYGLMTLLLALAAAAAASFFAMYGFVALIWDFPGSWQPLRGLPEAPQALLALQVPEDTFLVRTGSGLFTCQKQTCLPAAADWSTPAVRCDAANTPRVSAYFPTLLSGDITLALACERAYLDTAHTLYLAADRQGGVYQMVGLNFFPADVVVIGIGLLVGLGVFGVIALVGFAVSVVNVRSGRD